jgi:hypothetical protein
MEARLEVRVPAGLLERVDAARGDVPRSVWVRRALEAALSPAKAPAPVDRHHPDHTLPEPVPAGYVRKGSRLVKLP